MKITGVVRRDVACSQCGANINRVVWNYGKARPIADFFCNNVCKGEWQRAQREALGFTRDWLIEQYVTLERSANDIAREIKRDSKRVWEWIIDYGIPTRNRGHNHSQLPKDGSSFKGKKHTTKTKEAIRLCRVRDGHVPHLKNGVHWLRTPGAVHPNWKGGLTPERQAFYCSLEWKACVVAVWKRDDATCQRCKLDHRSVLRGTIGFHIHHIDSFSIRDRRACVDNLVLLCAGCHKWVHSNKNSTGLFLGKGHRHGSASAGDH